MWRGDITVLDVDAVVNAANTSLRRGGGVCGAIFRAAGPELDRACAEIGSCATGDAVATPGFDLPARWVIHAVGPVWRGGAAGEPAQLASCYRRVLEVADELGARSVAIPAISTGIYGYPAEPAARSRCPPWPRPLPDTSTRPSWWPSTATPSSATAGSSPA